MSGNELLEWVVINNHVMPLPDPWRQTAAVCAAVANFSGNVKKTHFPVQPDSFLPLARRPKPPTPWKVQQAKMMAYASKHAAKAEQASKAG